MVSISVRFLASAVVMAARVLFSGQGRCDISRRYSSHEPLRTGISAVVEDVA